MKDMKFEAFDTTKIEQYTAEAKASWGQSPAWQEYEGRRAGRSPERERQLGEGMMALMAEFGAMKDMDPAAPEVCAQVEKLRPWHGRVHPPRHTGRPRRVTPPQSGRFAAWQASSLRPGFSI